MFHKICCCLAVCWNLATHCLFLSVSRYLHGNHPAYWGRGRPPRLSHSSWTLTPLPSTGHIYCLAVCWNPATHRPAPGIPFILDICCRAVCWNPDCLVPRIPLYLMQSILGSFFFLRIIRSVNNWCVELCRKCFELKVFGLFVVFVSLLWKLTASVTDD